MKIDREDVKIVLWFFVVGTILISVLFAVGLWLRGRSNEILSTIVFNFSFYAPLQIVNLAAIGFFKYWDKGARGWQLIKAWRYGIWFVIGWGLVYIGMAVSIAYQRNEPVDGLSFIITVASFGVLLVAEMISLIYRRFWGRSFDHLSEL
jgi:hypothetical protein